MSIPGDTDQAQPPQVLFVAPEKKPIGAVKAVLIFFAYVLSQGVAGGIAIAGYTILRGAGALDLTSIDNMDPVLFLIAGTAGFVVGGPVVLGLARAFERGATFKLALAPLGWVKAKPGALWKSAALGVGIAVFFGFALEALFPSGDTPTGPLIEAASAPGWQRILFVVLAIVLAPLAEEFLFRGVMYTGMKRSWGAWPAGIVVTLLFAALHITDIAGYWPALALIALVGTALLLVRIRTESLWPGIVMHASYNGVQVLGLYLLT